MAEYSTPTLETVSDDETPAALHAMSLLKRLADVTREFERGDSRSVEDFRSLFTQFREAVEKIQALSGDKAKYDSGLETLREVEAFLSPDYWAKIAARNISLKAQTAEFPPEQLQKAKSEYERLSTPLKKQFDYLRRIVLTDDAFGIIIRGHVLLENRLLATLYNHIPKLKALPLMTFAQKLALAHALGILNEHELAVLTRFNRLRNDVAHLGSRETELPEFHVTKSDEESQWHDFITNPSISGNWPPYDGNKFPLHLRYVVVYLYLLLSNRAEDIKEQPVHPTLDTKAELDMKKLVFPIITQLAVKAISDLGDLSKSTAPTKS